METPTKTTRKPEEIERFSKLLKDINDLADKMSQCIGENDADKVVFGAVANLAQIMEERSPKLWNYCKQLIIEIRKAEDRIEDAKEKAETKKG